MDGLFLEDFADGFGRVEDDPVVVADAELENVAEFDGPLTEARWCFGRELVAYADKGVAFGARDGICSAISLEVGDN